MSNLLKTFVNSRQLLLLVVLLEQEKLIPQKCSIHLINKDLTGNCFRMQSFLIRCRAWQWFQSTIISILQVSQKKKHTLQYSINPTPSGSILNLFHLGAAIFCQHTYSSWVRQFFANIRFILYFLILALIVKVSLAIFCQTREE